MADRAGDLVEGPDQHHLEAAAADVGQKLIQIGTLGFHPADPVGVLRTAEQIKVQIARSPRGRELPKCRTENLTEVLATAGYDERSPVRFLINHLQIGPETAGRDKFSLEWRNCPD